MNSIWPGLTAQVICLIMSIPCFTMAGECALSLNSGSKEYKRKESHTPPEDWDRMIVVVSLNSPIEDVQWRPFVSGGVYKRVQLVQDAWDTFRCGFPAFRANSWISLNTDIGPDTGLHFTFLTFFHR